MPISLKPKPQSGSKTRSKPGPKPGAKRTAKQSSNGNGRRTSTKGRTVANGQRKRPVQRSGITQSEMSKHIKRLERDRSKVEKLDEQRNEAIDERFDHVVEALDAGVGITLIQEAVGVSRQNLYKGLSNRGYASDGTPLKGATKKRNATAKRSAARASTNGKPASKPRSKPGPKPKAKGRAKISLKR
jgi:DNA-binding phage protein